MAYSDVIFSALDFTAAGDLSDEQYTFVSRTTGKTVDQTGAGEAAVGVLWNAPAAAGRAATVVVKGRPHVYVGTGGVSAGDAIASDAAGQAVTADTGDVVLGIALADAGAGEFVQIDLLADPQYTSA